MVGAPGGHHPRADHALARQDHVLRLPPDAGQVLLNDPEGTPLAVLDITERLAVGSAGDRPAGGAAVGSQIARAPPSMSVVA